MKNSEEAPCSNEIFVGRNGHFLILAHLTDGYEDSEYSCSFWSAVLPDGLLGVVEIGRGCSRAGDGFEYFDMEFRRWGTNFNMTESGFEDAL